MEKEKKMGKKMYEAGFFDWRNKILYSTYVCVWVGLKARKFKDPLFHERRYKHKTWICAILGTRKVTDSAAELTWILFTTDSKMSLVVFDVNLVCVCIPKKNKRFVHCSGDRFSPSSHRSLKISNKYFWFFCVDQVSKLFPKALSF
jgi:hypothetical protein